MSQENRNIRFLLTGAGGLIGSQLLLRLKSRGYVVAGLARGAPTDTELIECDLASPGDLGRALSLASPDLILHAAGSLLGADPALAVEGYYNNLIAMAHVLRAATKQGVKRLILIFKYGLWHILPDQPGPRGTMSPAKLVRTQQSSLRTVPEGSC